MLPVSRVVVRLIVVIGLMLMVAASAAAQSTPAGNTAGEPLIDQIIIKYRDTGNSNQPLLAAPATELKRLSDAAGAEITYAREMSGGAHVLRLVTRQTLAEVAQKADRLAALPEVEYAVPDRILRPLLTPNDPQYTSQWHYFDTYGIDAPAAWDITTGSADIVVAVVDTGILAHADLAGRSVSGYDFVTDSRIANDGGGRDSDPSDPGDWITSAENASGFFAGCGVSGSSWHGSHVAGTIGAASNNNLGVAGINWNSKILPVRVLGKCGGTDSDIIDGMRWAAGLSVPGAPANANPAKVLNMSLGGTGACDAAQQAAINEIVAAGTTVVVAAGNSNADASNFSPASCNNVISVAATNRSGNRSYYSNYGSVVDIAAPGGETSVSTNGVLSTLNAGTTSPGADAYAYYQGTSMAAPHVAGVASLVVSLNPTLSPNQVYNILRGTIKAFPGGSTCNTSICGTGIVNAYNAVNLLPRITSYTPSIVPAGSGSVTLVITGANFISGTLVKWNSANLATTFVNSTQVTAVVSASLLTTAGSGNVTASINHPTYGTLTTAAKQVIVKGNQTVFLPLAVKNWPLVPAAPVLLAINNPSQATAYSVVWNGVSYATSYTLQEDDNAAFSSPVTAYSGANTSWSASSKPVGTYYYRVQAANANGSSGWSSTQSTVVQSASNLPLAGFWESTTGDEFYVTTDRSYVDEFAIYLTVNGCGSYKITNHTAIPIANNQFSFTGSFYASGTFNSTTSASGQDGLSSFNITGCGLVTGGPWSYTATWQNATQPTPPLDSTAMLVGEDGVTRIVGVTVSHSATSVR